jgi:hypothetical protein
VHIGPALAAAELRSKAAGSEGGAAQAVTALVRHALRELGQVRSVTVEASTAVPPADRSGGTRSAQPSRAASGAGDDLA